MDLSQRQCQVVRLLERLVKRSRNSDSWDLGFTLAPQSFEVPTNNEKGFAWRSQNEPFERARPELYTGCSDPCVDAAGSLVRPFSHRFNRTAFDATMIDDSDIKSAETSGRSTMPRLGWRTPAATGIASKL